MLPHDTSTVHSGYIVLHQNTFNECGPVMDWRPVHGVRCLSPNDSWDSLQPSRDPELDKRKKLYGLMDGKNR